MRLAIMQPYFVPYLGYFQLINYVDKFVSYDDIQFTKKGWIHRNRILSGAGGEYISLPLKKDSDYLNVCERQLADDFEKTRTKLLRRVENVYRKAPFFDSAFTIFELVIGCSERNLFNFIHHSVLVIAKHLSIETPIVVSSMISNSGEFERARTCLGYLQAMQATEYVNPVGGLEALLF